MPDTLSLSELERQVLEQQILDRDGHRCKRCDRPHGHVVYVACEGSSYLPTWWFDARFGRWRDSDGTVTRKQFEDIPQHRRAARSGFVSVEYLDGDRDNLRDNNLAALCTACQAMHRRPHYYRRNHGIPQGLQLELFSRTEIRV